jgi:carboxyl-terminal processing protease
MAILKANRTLLLALSGVVTALVVAGGVAVALGAGDGAYRQVRVFSEVLALVLDNYVEEVEPAALLEGAYRGLLGSLGARGAYLRKEQVESWKQGPIGQADPGLVVVKAFGSLEVVSVLPGSPAEAAGIVAGDQIRRVDGEPVRDLSLDQAVRKLRGSPGSTVRLGLLRPLQGYRRQEVVLPRAVRSGNAYNLSVEDGVAVLAIVDPNRVDATELARELEELERRRVGRLLLDLRNVTEASPRAIAPLGELFTSGPLFKKTDRTGKLLETVESRRPRPAWSGELALLVNSATADGAEGLAKLLQARRHALVFGEETYGLGAEAKLVELPDGTGLLVPAYTWATAEGAVWDGEGIVPDRIVRAEGNPAQAASGQLRRVLEEWTKAEKKAA